VINSFHFSKRDGVKMNT